MNLRVVFFSLWMICAWTARGGETESPQPLLKWQNQDGRVLEASFVKVEEHTLFLRKTDGAEISVRIDDLEEGSKLQALDLARRGRARAAKVAHDQETYRLRMYPKSVPFTLDVLENGKGIDYGPFLSEVLLSEQTPEGEKLYRSQGMKTPVREDENGAQWRGRMQNQMQVDLRIRRAEQSLTLTWELLTAEKPSATLQARVSLVFPAMEKTSPMARELRIRAVTAEGEVRELDASSPTDAFAGDFRSLDVTLPGTKTRLSLRVPENGNGVLGLHVEPTQGLAEGFRVDSRLKNARAGKPADVQIDFSVPE